MEIFFQPKNVEILLQTTVTLTENHSVLIIRKQQTKQETFGEQNVILKTNSSHC